VGGDAAWNYSSIPASGIPLYGIIVPGDPGRGLSSTNARRRGKPYPWGREAGFSVILTVAHGFTGFITQAVIIGIFAAPPSGIGRITTMPMDHWWSLGPAHRVGGIRLLLVSPLVASDSNFSGRTIVSITRPMSSPSPRPTGSLAAPILFPCLVVLHADRLDRLPRLSTLFSVVGLNLAYQFLAAFHLDTPARAHRGDFSTPPSAPSRPTHGSNPRVSRQELRAGIVMIFDRIFGTYVAEDPAIEIRYGAGHGRAFRQTPVWVAYWRLSQADPPRCGRRRAGATRLGPAAQAPPAGGPRPRPRADLISGLAQYPPVAVRQAFPSDRRLSRRIAGRQPQASASASVPKPPHGIGPGSPGSVTFSTA